MMNHILFYDDIHLRTDDTMFCARIKPVSNAKELFVELNQNLVFPYFGFNWDALWDLYCDFHWINQKNIHIFHESVGELVNSYGNPTKNALDIYISIIYDTCEEWEKRYKHNIFFYFNKKEKDVIQSYLDI